MCLFKCSGVDHKFVVTSCHFFTIERHISGLLTILMLFYVISSDFHAKQPFLWAQMLSLLLYLFFLRTEKVEEREMPLMLCDILVGRALTSELKDSFLSPAESRTLSAHPTIRLGTSQ